MNGYRWSVSVAALGLGVALAIPALAVDSSKVSPGAQKPGEVHVIPVVKQWNIPGVPPVVVGDGEKEFMLEKGKSYKVTVYYTVPPAVKPGPGMPRRGPVLTVVPDSSVGTVWVRAGWQESQKWEFIKVLCISIPPVKQGATTNGLDSESFQIPANLQAAPKVKVLVIAPAKDCKK